MYGHWSMKVDADIEFCQLEFRLEW